MPREFKYDVIQLICNVRDRPCLWNKSLESYKDRIERRMAWEEVFNILEPRYEEMSQSEKKITSDHILNKWTNVRDTFVKTLRTRAGNKHRRKYILHKQLEFLVKVVSENHNNSEDGDDSNPEITDDPITYSTHLKYEKDEKEASPSFSTRKRKKRESVEEVEVPKRISKEYDKDSNFDFAEVDEINDPRIMNEDEAFFASLLPSVVRYNEDERLEFRIEVLAIMRRIKDNRKWTTDT